ncbi:hypothetical protein D9757_003908 [Collybiopsis confluens]|uniref:Uncharacterized protein n=1 Tax=Collybiopsis confluens TaxID=2823264 RepID=A0A8H5MDM5_9AGAR|nr:hypothetical protein D9757_003908 [Collybiopsis confluens]
MRVGYLNHQDSFLVADQWGSEALGRLERRSSSYPLVVLQTQNKESHAPTHSINNYSILQMRLYAIFIAGAIGTGYDLVYTHVDSALHLRLWIPILAFETLLFVLAVLRGIQTYRQTGTTFQSNKRLVQLLEVPIGFSIAFSCVLGNRVILNVRKVNEEVKSESGNTRLRGNMAFNKGSSGTNAEHESDTLTDFEMAQLRSLRAESLEGSHIVV